MKKLLLAILIITSLYSCKKDGGTSPTAPIYNITSLVSVDTSGDSTVYKFTYDVNSNLVYISYRNSGYDNFGNSWIDSGSQSFYYKQNESFPRNYTTIYRKSVETFTSISNDTLIYNSQGRVIEDSVISGFQLSSFFKYNYLGSNIFVTQSDGLGGIGMDTIVLSNGNLTKMSFGFAYMDSYTVSNYTNYPNPYYNPKISNILGALFTDGNWFDALSTNLSDYGMGATYTTDSQGRVIKIIGGVYGITTITYK